MKFGFDQEIADLEHEIMNNSELTVQSVFKDTAPRPAMTPERMAEQRRNWRPVQRGDIKVEVKRSRHLPGRKID